MRELFGKYMISIIVNVILKKKLYVVWSLFLVQLSKKLAEWGAGCWWNLFSFLIGQGWVPSTQWEKRTKSGTDNGIIRVAPWQPHNLPVSSSNNRGIQYQGWEVVPDHGAWVDCETVHQARRLDASLHKINMW